MKARILAALVLLAAAAAPVRALDWNKPDPASAWWNELPAATLAAPAAAPVQEAAAGLSGPAAGQFDTYVFSLEWIPEFCETQQGDECAGMTPDRWDAKNLSLHGLWPDQSRDTSHSYGYCGVPPSVKALDNKASWCRMPAPGISEGTLRTLSDYMPGTVACLQNHEWYKHGTCSGLAADDYFARASALTAQFAAMAPGRFITANVGKTVNGADLLAAFESAFGAGSGRLAALRCAKVRGQDMLAEVRLSLKPALGASDDLGSLLLPAGPGSCPASFLIDPPSFR
jgi:ribonuclease T2